MSVLTFCQWLQDTQWSESIRESTWAFTILAAVHVLGLAWFGGALLVTNRRLFEDDAQIRAWKRVGFALVMISGALLFGSQPLRYYQSTFFRFKMLLLALVCVNALVFRVRTRASAWLSLALWTAILFAGRGIAFF